MWCDWLSCLCLGPRKGEGLALRWSDVDWDAKTVRLSQTVQRVRGDVDPKTGRRKGKLAVKDMKTDSSSGVQPAGETLLDALRDHQRQQRAARMRSSTSLDADLIFTTTVGTALEPRNVDRACNKVCGRAGVEGTHIHDLRHACGTYLADEGLHPRAIHTALRHSRMATTEVYVHARAEANRAPADAMDRVVADLRSRRGDAGRKSS